MKTPINFDSFNAESDIMAMERRIFDTQYDVDLAHCDEIARSRGLIVITPAADILTIDLDSELAKSEFFVRLSVLDCPQDHHIVPSSEQGHYHAYVKLDHPVTEWERIAMQAALGDDPIRVILNTRRLLVGCENPCRLFEAPTFKLPWPFATLQCKQ